MGKKILNEATTKAEPVIEETALYAVALELRELFGNIRCSIQTPNDITLIQERQALLDKVVEQFNEEMQKTPIPERATDEEIITIRTPVYNKAMMSNSQLTRKSVAFFTVEELMEGIKGQVLSNRAISLLFYWFVKAEPTVPTE